jgi:hypothetical protein
MPLDVIDKWTPFLTALGGAITVALALKKDWLTAKFTKKQREVEIGSKGEKLETSQIETVEKYISLYDKLLVDLPERFQLKIDKLVDMIKELEAENDRLGQLVKKQRTFIRKQARSLRYYQNTCICDKQDDDEDIEI